MKAVKYLAVGALMLSLSAPVYAQVDAKAAIEQVEAILNAQPADADKQINKIAGKFKKDATTLAAIGNLYMRTSNYDKATEYADKADAAAKHKSAAAFVLKGDIAAANDDGGEAAMWYQQAQVMEPTYPDGYIRYAYLMRKSGLNASLQVLETLQKNVPGYNINFDAAKICMLVDKKDDAYNYFQKADVSKVREKDLVDFATDFFTSQQFDRSLAVAEAGVKAFPANQPLTRLVFFNNTKLKNYAEGMQWAEKLFAFDGMKPTTLDLQTLGEAQEGAELYEKAIETYNNLYNYEGVSDVMKDYALKSIAAVYGQKGDFKAAVDAHKYYLENGSAIGSADYKRLLAAQTKYANTFEGDEKKAAFNEVLATIDLIQEKYGETIYCLYQKAVVGIQTGDNAGAKEAYVQMVDYINANDLAAKNKDMLVSAYYFNMVYYLQFEVDKEKTLEYAKKLLEVDPTNENAKRIVDAAAAESAAEAAEE